MGIKKHLPPEVIKKLQESWPTIGSDYADYGWTLLTQDNYRDLEPIIQDRMQDISAYLYDANPLAHRIIEMTKDFIVGSGFTFKARNDKVQAVLDRHWNDFVNNWEVKQDQKAKELGLFGEQFYPVFINPYNGLVRLGYLDPVRVSKVVADPRNPEVLRYVITKEDKKGEVKKYTVVNPNNVKGSKDYGLLEGEIFVFQINKVSNSVRGRSDLLPLADWMDGYDQFLFARLERANILNNYVWDVLLEDASDKEIQAWLQQQTTPKPGSLRAHNQKVTWNAVSPKLESSDASKEANLFKMQILGGAGFPNLWFGEGEETIRAGAVEMSLPTLKHLEKRQMYVKNMIKFILKFQIDQSIKAGALPRDIDKTFEVFSPPLVRKKEMQMGIAASRVTESIKIAQENGWITKEQAAEAWNGFMKEVVGLDMGSLDEEEETKGQEE